MIKQENKQFNKKNNSRNIIMRKNILKATFVAALTVFAGYNVYQSQNINILSDLTLANVEALADDSEYVERDDFTSVYYPEKGDDNYETVKCVCCGSGGNLSCC